jgi:hypothetical protein
MAEMATAAELQVRDKIFIGGEWVEPQSTDSIEVVNQTTEEVMGSIPACTPGDADRAVRAARDAFDSWSQTSREERAGYLSAIAAGLGERSEEIAATIAQELGMPLKLSPLLGRVGQPVPKSQDERLEHDQILGEDDHATTADRDPGIGVNPLRCLHLSDQLVPRYFGHRLHRHLQSCCGRPRSRVASRSTARSLAGDHPDPDANRRKNPHG